MSETILSQDNLYVIWAGTLEKMAAIAAELVQAEAIFEAFETDHGWKIILRRDIV